MAKRGRPRHPDILTPREWDVLALLREGATNEQIAERLGITERTAKFHVSEILGKLGVSSREEAAAWQPEEGRAWWLAARVPLGFVWRRTAGAAGHGVNAVGVAIGGAMFAAVIAGIVLLALFLQRDSGSSGAATPVRNQTSSKDVKPIANALFSGNASQVESLLRFTRVPCTERPVGPGAPPQCRPGEADGTPVEVFPVARCEGAYVRPDALQDVISGLANAGPQVVSVYEYSPIDANPNPFLYGDFVAVATIGQAPAPQSAGGVWIGNGGITGVHLGCAQTPSEFAASWHLENPIDLGPLGDVTSSTPTKMYRDNNLGIELKYPGSWIEGAALRSWDIGDLHAWPCSNCVAFGPPQAARPDGVYIYANNNVEPTCIVDTAWRCPVAARAHGGIDAVQQGDERDVSVAGEDAGQADVLRTVPASVTAITGETTPDDEIWTIEPLGNRALYVVAFWRDGDTVGEAETRAGYDLMLKSLTIGQR